MSLAIGLAGWSHAGRISQDKEIGLIVRLYAPKKEMRYKYFRKIHRLTVKLVHILLLITAVTQNHGNR